MIKIFESEVVSICSKETSSGEGQKRRILKSVVSSTSNGMSLLKPEEK